jgi:TDG/mug DNA glycosylase family protein
MCGAADSLHAVRLHQMVEAIQPRALAFNGKKAASMVYRVATGHLCYGQQSKRIRLTAVYVLPSTSATASGYWSVELWRALARDLI